MNDYQSWPPGIAVRCQHCSLNQADCGKLLPVSLRVKLQMLLRSAQAVKSYCNTKGTMWESTHNYMPDLTNIAMVFHKTSHTVIMTKQLQSLQGLQAHKLLGNTCWYQRHVQSHDIEHFQQSCKADKVLQCPAWQWLLHVSC